MHAASTGDSATTGAPAQSGADISEEKESVRVTLSKPSSGGAVGETLSFEFDVTSALTVSAESGKVLTDQWINVVYAELFKSYSEASEASEAKKYEKQSMSFLNEMDCILIEGNNDVSLSDNFFNDLSPPPLRITSSEVEEVVENLGELSSMRKKWITMPKLSVVVLVGVTKVKNDAF